MATGSNIEIIPEPAANAGRVTGKLFGCWHRDLSWPFTVDGETYRVCLHCGAKRQFIAESWQTVGAYYRETIARDQKQEAQRNKPAPPQEKKEPQHKSAPPHKKVRSRIGLQRLVLQLRASTIFRGLRTSFVAFVEGRHS
jgi:hypothetical protein